VEEDYLLFASSEMATTLSQDQVKVLEQTRQRLVQLTHSLGSLAASLQQSDPLPPWYILPVYVVEIKKKKNLVVVLRRNEMRLDAVLLIY
jgi:hypothetical protein